MCQIIPRAPYCPFHTPQADPTREEYDLYGDGCNCGKGTASYDNAPEAVQCLCPAEE